MPAKGGCGASTIASNLAYQMKRGDKRILLADLDPLAGTLSFLLKIKSNYSFMDALARSHDIDADLWRSVVTSRGRGGRAAFPGGDDGGNERAEGRQQHH